jgi:hypothetical protein
MQTVLRLPFLAPVPVGHRVQVVRASHWGGALFGGEPSWVDVPDPVVVDLETGVIYAPWRFHQHVVPAPFGFAPNSGYRIASTGEGRVASCLVSAEGGERSILATVLTVESDPQGYRG